MLYFIAPGRGGTGELLTCAGCGAAVARTADIWWRYEATGAEQPPSFYGLLENRLEARALS